MTVLFNVTDAIGPASNHGITRTERELARALVGRPEVEFVVIAAGQAWRVDREVIASTTAPTTPTTRGGVPRVERFGVDQPPAPERRMTVVRRALLSRSRRPTDPPIRSERAVVSADDVFVSVGLDWVHGALDFANQHMYGTGGRYVGFCYDTIPIDHPEWVFPPDPEGFRGHLRQAARVASSMVCISECTRADFVRHFPDYGDERVNVIRLGADATVRADRTHHDFAASLFDGEPYAIYCATLDRRKNHQLLYRAVRELARRGASANVAFVGMVGSGVRDLLDALRHDRSIAGRIAHVTNCGDRHLAALYARATFAVYPSLYEGWGLGVTEALAHGKPCLIASGSSLGEAGLGVCRELHPLRTAAWADAMNEYAVEPPALPPFELPTWSDAGRSLIEMATT
jgi:glycosyltransferase involved in cell wall biosynthesis